MTFHRTASGLANLYLFFNVDRVIYCEGGAQITPADAESGGGDEETIDAQYWQAIFLNFGTTRNNHVKSVGSKTVLLEIARKVIASNITRVAVCFDRDFDDIRGIALNDSRVVYSFGYSFENDLVQAEVLEDVFFLLRNRNVQSEKDWKFAESKRASFLRAVERYCSYDCHYICRGEQALFIRSRGSSCLTLAQNSLPKLDKVLIKQRLKDRGHSRGIRVDNKIPIQDVERRIYGKLLSYYCYHLISHFVAKGNKAKTPYDVFMRVAITRWVERIKNGGLPQLKSYYNSAVP